MKYKGFLVLLAFAFLRAEGRQGYQFDFQNPALSIEARLDDLLSKLTLEEKILQMQNRAPAIPRLAIPEYNWWNEALHGVARNGTATVFPQAIGMAATWNPELIRREAEVISTEARAKHHEDVRNNRRGLYQGLTFWSPNINIFRDPRWGRGQETYGEDPVLTSRIASSFVKGLQGNDPKYFKVIATPKHYAVHSGPESTRHSFDATTDKRDLYETYLPAFEAAIKGAGAWSVMGAYNRYLGEPCCASHLLLGEILRKRWGFPGYVVSDCGAIWDIYNGHALVKDASEASALAVKAGCDLTCGNEYASLLQAVKSGLITEKVIDVSVRRLMAARIRLGMFDPPEMVPYSQIPISMNDTREHDSLAADVARESIVLLKNEKKTLPMKKNLRSVAVIGPNADDVSVLLGNYNGLPSHPVTILQGIKNKVGPSTKVLYARGCELADGMIPRLAPIGPKNLQTSEGGRSIPGLTGSYYPNQTMSGDPASVRVDKSVDFDWGIASPAEGIPPDGFSVRWTGKLIADRSGTFMLGVTVDDGFRLFIDGAIFLEEWKNGGERSFGKEIAFKAGEEHDIRLEYYEHGGDAVARLGWGSTEIDPLAEAIAAAKDCEQIIAVLGLSPQLEGEEMSVRLKGFSGGDRTDLELPGPQARLLEALMALGKPTVLVLLNGSALSVRWAQQYVPAIVEAWYPGQQGGNAVADVIFGNYNPAGRLPVTFSNSVKDLPPFEEYAMKGRTYRYFKGTPLYPFGHGLSYTRFDYRKVDVSKRTVSPRDTIHVGITIANTGDSDGDEVLQVYVRYVSQSDRDPLKSLKAFARVHLKQGKEQHVRIPLATMDLKQYDEAIDDYAVKPGSYEILIGASSSDIRLTTRIQVNE